MPAPAGEGGDLFNGHMPPAKRDIGDDAVDGDTGDELFACMHAC